MASPKIDLNSLVGPSSQPEGTTAIQTGLVAILEPRLNAHTAPNGLAAESVAVDIDNFYASGWDTEEKAESFFWFVWELYIEAAKKIPADDTRQQFLVSVLDTLKSKKRGTVKIWSQEAIVWDNLPLFGPCLREAWNLRRKFDNSEEDNLALQQWISLNSFNARLLGGLVQDFENFALWALRESLEVEPVNDTARDCHLAVVYEWIEHAGKVIYDKGRTHKELDEMEQRALKPGRLFEGESGFTEKRWQFWQQRLEEELGKGISNEEVKAKVQKAVEKMKSLEG